MKDRVLEELKNAVSRIPERNQLDNYLDNLAEFIFQKLTISNACSTYRFTEIEFYIYSHFHPDPFSHKHSQQLEFGCWYIHESGLDITFGDKKNYASYLVRGIQNLDENCKQKYTSGPLRVLKELCNSSRGLISSGINLRVDYSDQLERLAKIKHRRIGLNPDKKVDGRVFSEKNYRYITGLHPDHKFPQKSQVIEYAYKDGQEFTARDAFNYNPGFLKKPK